MKKLFKFLLISVVLIFVGGFLFSCLLDDDEDYDDYDDYGYEDVDDDYNVSMTQPAATEAPVSSNNTDTAPVSISTGDGTATVLIYMIGSDLESEDGAGTQDIAEILTANISDKVNIILQTGGAKKWNHKAISAKEIGRFKLESGNITKLESLPLVSMAKESTLTDFLKWGAKNYPADDTYVILWNHGGGTIGGYGYDELFPNDSLSISDMASAFKKAGVHFDVIGFDACLMATVETAYALYPYADYLIASEETEPGTGWYYTNWITQLSKTPEGNIINIGKKIIDDFINGPDSSFFDRTTLSLVDLSKIPDIYEKLNLYYLGETSTLTQGNYRNVSYSRSRATSFGDGDYDQIDIVSYLNEVDSAQGDALIQAINDAVIYSDSTINDTHGLAMYFPYGNADSYQDTYDDYYSEYDDSDYGYDFFSEFLSIMLNEQYDDEYYDECYGDSWDDSSFDWWCDSDRSAKREQLMQAPWYRSGAKDTTESGFLKNTDGELTITEKGSGYVLQLTDEQWNNISDISMNVWFSDDDGFLDLGMDDLYEIDRDGNLVIDYDYTWLALNGQVVPYLYEASGERADGSWYSYGYVPATLTRKGNSEEQDIEILIFFDEDHADGYVAGYRHLSDSNSKMYPRNLSQFENGDRLDFYADYYTQDGEYDDSYYVGEPLTVKGELTVSYEEMEECTTWIYFTIRDLYQNEYYTETVELSFE